MLVLTRRKNETLILETREGPIVITIGRLGSTQIRLGLDAPPSVRVRRGEVPALPRPEPKPAEPEGA